MRVREKRTIGKGHAADDDNGIDLIEHPSIPVIVLHIDETQGATIDEMHADTDHNTECHGTMDIIVPEGFEGYVGMDAIPQTIKRQASLCRHGRKECCNTKESQILIL